MKYVYAFSEGNKDMRELLGGKGANLAEMTRIELREFNTFEITNLCKPLKNGYFFVKFPTLVLSII